MDRLSKPSPRLSTKTVYAHRYHRTAQTVPIAVTPVIGTLKDLYRKIAESVHPPLLNPVQHVYTEEGDRIDNVLDLANGQHVYFVCAGDFVPSKQPKTKKARNAALQREREVVGRVSSPVKKPVRKIIMKRRYRKEIEQSMKMQGIRDPYASMDVVIFNKFSTVDELIYSINKTSPVQVVAIYDLSGHKKEFLDQFDDGETVWMQIRGDPPISVSKPAEKRKSKKAKLDSKTKKGSAVKKKKKTERTPSAAVAAPIYPAPPASLGASEEGETDTEGDVSIESDRHKEAEEAVDEAPGVPLPTPVHLVWDRVDSQQPLPVALHLDAEEEMTAGAFPEEEAAPESPTEELTEEDQGGPDEKDSKTDASNFPMAKAAAAGVVGAAVGGGVTAAAVRPGHSGVASGMDVPSTELVSEPDLLKADTSSQPIAVEAQGSANDFDAAGAEGNGLPILEGEDGGEAFKPLEAFEEEASIAAVKSDEDKGTYQGAEEEAREVLEGVQTPPSEEQDASIEEQVPTPAAEEANAAEDALEPAVQEPKEGEETQEDNGTAAAISTGLLAGGIAGAGAGVGVAHAVGPTSHSEQKVLAAGTKEVETPAKGDTAVPESTDMGENDDIFFTPAGKEEDGMQTPVIGPSAEQEEDKPMHTQEPGTEVANEPVLPKHGDVESDEVLPDVEAKAPEVIAEPIVSSESQEGTEPKPAKKDKKSKGKTKETSGKKSKKGEKKKKGGLFSCSCFGGGK